MNDNTAVQPQHVRPPFGMIDRTIWDDPRFLSLSYSARGLLIYLKTCPAGAGMTGIFTVRPQEVREHLGLSKKATDKALRDLEAAAWIKTEGRFVWVIDQMRSAPSISMKNPKHRVAAERALSLVPHLKLAREFRDHYGLNDGDGMGIPYPIGNPMAYPPSSSMSTSTSSISGLNGKGNRGEARGVALGEAGEEKKNNETNIEKNNNNDGKNEKNGEKREGPRRPKLCDIFVDRRCYGRGVYSHDGVVLCARHRANLNAPAQPPGPGGWVAEESVGTIGR